MLSDKERQVVECFAAERAALTEQAETYEQRIEELTGVRLTVGDGLEVYGTGEAIRRAQAYILMDSSHPIEAKDTARYFATALQVAEQRIRELGAQRVPEWQPIETAPNNELILLGPTKRMGVCVGMNHSFEGWVTETPSDWVSIYTPTHWMPLPAAPIAELNKGE